MRLFVFLGSLIAAGQLFAAETSKPADWAMNATIIEACSCPMFCQCYFNTKPAAPGPGCHNGGEHFCKFNNAFKVNKGHWNDVKLAGAKFWVAGDLGGDFSKGDMEWAVVVFDPSVTKEQRDAITAILKPLYPANWKSFTVGKDLPIDWNGGKDRAVAKLDGGKGGEVVLKRFPGMTDEPVVVKNLKYWGAPRNEGFVLMPNEIEAFRAVPEGRKPYEFRNGNGFMITLDITSKDVAKVASTAGY
jgi:hypothetical protein